jgi:glycosyltransferase involved in cell wall biosynthesis
MATFSANIEKDEVEVIKYSGKSNQLLRLLHMCWGIVKYSKSCEYILIDVFSSSAFYYAYATSQIARLLNKKYIPILRGGNLPYRINTSVWLSNAIFNHSYQNVAPSGYLKEAFEKRGYKTMYIPNILEIDRYQFKKRNPLQPKLFWVRAFKHLYNPMLAIDVFELVLKDYPQAKLCMVGPEKDDSFELVKKEIEKRNFSDKVELTGVLSKSDWHKKSEDFDIFINTTNFDNTPVSVMEAMALGLPVVSTNVGGMPYLIKDGVDGILVEKENAQAMKDAIVSLLVENTSQEVAVNARKKAESFAWKSVKKQWFELMKIS